MMRMRSRISTTVPAVAAMRGALRFNSNDTAPKTQGGYDKEADLAREAQAKANLFKNGMPSPFRMMKESAGGANTAAASAASAGGTEAMPPKGPLSKGALDEAWQEALRETSKRFFGVDKTPSGVQELLEMSRRKRAGLPPSPDTPATPSKEGESTSSQTAASTSSTGTPSSSSTGGAAPTGNPFTAGANPFGGAAGAGMPSMPAMPASINGGRLFAGLIIVWCSMWIMRRQGMFGNFDHIHIPHWASNPEDTSKWLIFLFNIELQRRLEIEQMYHAARMSYPGLSFFDYVDSIQPDWRSSPTYSKETVLAAVAQMARNDNTWKTIGTVRAGLESGSGMFGGWFGGSDATLTPYQRRIDALMKIIPAPMPTHIPMQTSGFRPMSIGSAPQQQYGGAPEGRYYGGAPMPQPGPYGGYQHPHPSVVAGGGQPFVGMGVPQQHFNPQMNGSMQQGYGRPTPTWFPPTQGDGYVIPAPNQFAPPVVAIQQQQQQLKTVEAIEGRNGRPEIALQQHVVTGLTPTQAPPILTMQQQYEQFQQYQLQQQQLQQQQQQQPPVAVEPVAIISSDDGIPESSIASPSTLPSSPASA